MNVNDSDLVYGILQNYGYEKTENAEMADVRLIMTCSVRDKPERVVWAHLQKIKHENAKKDRKMSKNVNNVKNSETADFDPKTSQKQLVGVLGCMAERVRDNFGDLADIIAGPDSYRSLPFLLADIEAGNKLAFNVELSNDETYSDILPVDSGNIGTNKSSFLSISRGCDNMCTFCIVPFTRGRERNKPMMEILKEVQQVSDSGQKEVVLLGQNVNSYRDLSVEPRVQVSGNVRADGFKTVYQSKKLEIGSDFGELLDRVAEIDPELTIRFTSPHPKDFNDNVIHSIKRNKNIARWLHFPLQSGSTNVLKSMRRGYTREAYDTLFHRIKHVLNDHRGVSFSTDMIVGFCGESEDDHLASLDAINQYSFSQIFAFAYSERPGSPASRKLKDDVEEIVKKRRLNEMIRLYTPKINEIASTFVGKRVLAFAHRENFKLQKLYGFTDTFHKIYFHENSENVELGQYYDLEVVESKGRVLYGKVVNKSSVSEFYT